MIYKFRAILDTKEDIFRDIAIEKEATLEDLHNAIVNAFGFDGTEMASFYTCDDNWNQKDEISLFDTGEIPGEIPIMNRFPLEDILDEETTKIIYVYDFLSMWTFLVELGAIEEKENGENYPQLLYSHGEIPENAPDKKFEADELGNEFKDSSFDNDFDSFDFEDNWN